MYAIPLLARSQPDRDQDAEAARPILLRAAGRQPAASRSHRGWGVSPFARESHAGLAAMASFIAVSPFMRGAPTPFRFEMLLARSKGVPAVDRATQIGKPPPALAMCPNDHDIG